MAIDTEKTNLDLLRAFAVLAVLFDHTCSTIGRWTDGPISATSIGIFGVFLFFVHTSLVLMWSLERKPHTLDFYIRRIFRIYPLAIFVVVVVLALKMPLAGRPHAPFVLPPRGVKDIIANLLLVQNFSHVWPTESVMWSLPLEVQMYVALPMIFAFAHRERRAWPLVLLWAMAAIAAKTQLQDYGGNIFAFVPCFLPGIIAYVGFMRIRQRLPAWSFAFFVAALLAVYEIRPSLPVGWVCCLALGLALPVFRQATNRYITAAGHSIAKYSYSIYLLHLWSLALAFHYLHFKSTLVAVAIELISLAILAPLAYNFIERPMVEAGSRIAKRLAQRYDPQTI